MLKPPSSKLFGAMEVSLQPVNEFADLEGAWRTLERRCEPSFFVSWSWIGPWLKLLPEEVSTLVVQVRDSIGEVVGLGIIVPNRQKRHGIIRVEALNLNTTGSDALDCLAPEYNGFLLDREVAISAANAILRYICSKTSLYDELSLGCLDENNQLLTEQARSGTDLTLNVDRFDVCHYIDFSLLGTSDYLSSLGRSTKARIKRSLQSYEASGHKVVVEAATSVTEALEFLDKLENLHQAYWRSKGREGGFANPFFKTFHTRLIQELFFLGKVQLLRVRAGPRTIGYLYNFIHTSSVLSYQSGFVYDDPRLSPGLVCHYKSIEYNRGLGAKVYNFLAGDSQYKESLANAKDTMCWPSLQRPRLSLRFENKLRQCKRFVNNMLSIGKDRRAPRVFILIDTAALGGPGKGLLQFLKHADHTRFSFRLATFSYRYPRSTEFVERAKKQGIEPTLLPEKFRFDPRTILAALREILRTRCNIIQTHGYKGHVIAYILSRILRIRWIAFSHGWTDENLKMRLYNRLDLWLLKRADVCVAVSSEMREYLAKLRGVKRQTVTIHNAVDARELLASQSRDAVRATFGMGHQDTVLGVFGRLSPEKGHEIFLKAMAQVLPSRPGLKALFVGDGPLRAKLLELIESLGLKEAVYLTGYQKNIRDYYEAIDLLVLPSLQEGLPNVVLESISLGTPVLATAVGGTKEVVVEGKSGWLIPPNNISELCSSLLKLTGPAGVISTRAFKRSGLPHNFTPAWRSKHIVELYRGVLNTDF